MKQMLETEFSYEAICPLMCTADTLLACARIIVRMLDVRATGVCAANPVPARVAKATTFSEQV